MQKLPKSLETDENFELILRGIERSSLPLWAQSEFIVPHIDYHEQMRHALSFARRCGSLHQGLDNIAAILQTEEAGFAALKARGQSVGERVSRLLIVSNDGSERFYRQCESILKRHGNRLLGLKIQIDSATLGSALFGKNKVAKAMLVNRKESVVKLLSAFQTKT